MNKKNNQRFQETERKLEEAFLTLCQDQTPEKVTVSQLCKAVGINRSTFYDHYLDIPDLIRKTGIKYMEDIGRLLNDENAPGTFPLTENNLVRLLEYMRTHQKFFRIYLNHTTEESVNSGLSALWKSVRDICHTRLLEQDGGTDDETLKYIFWFYRAGFHALLQRWLYHGCRETPQRIAELLLDMLP